MVRREHSVSAGQGYEAQLPAQIEVGDDAHPTTICFSVADDFETQTQSTLRLVLYDHTIHDDLHVTLNDDELSVNDAWRTTRGFTHVVLDFALRPGQLRTGRNRVSATIRSRPRNLGTDGPRMDGVEAFVQYPEPGESV